MGNKLCKDAYNKEMDDFRFSSKVDLENGSMIMTSTHQGPMEKDQDGKLVLIQIS
jgi:hypothetical protein